MVLILVIVVAVYALRILLGVLGLPYPVDVLVWLIVAVGLLIVALRYLGPPPGGSVP